MISRKYANNFTITAYYNGKYATISSRHKMNIRAIKMF